MRRVLASSAQQLQAVCAYSTFLSASSLTLQRGGAGRSGGGGGARYNNGGPPQRGYDNRQQGYDNRQQGYDNRQREYGHPQRGYDNRQQGYGDRHQGNDSRERRYGDTRRQGYGDNQQRHGNRDGDGGHRRRGGNDSRPPPRSKTEFLASDAETLLQMKQAHKVSKSAKERKQILREARRHCRKVRVDASSQDERSIMIFLNCAAAFRCKYCDGLVEAVQWVQANFRALSPQNVALFANALGALDLPNATEVFRTTVVLALPSVMESLTPVEVVMTLQAFQRLKIRDNDELRNKLVLQLEPCITTMPVPQLSTLAEVLLRHPLRLHDEAKWRQLVEKVMSRALESAETMHSKEAITFLLVAPRMDVPAEQLCRLLARATATAGFHSDTQIGQLFSALVHIQKAFPDPTPELTAAAAALSQALVERLEKVMSFATVAGISEIWFSSVKAGTELPMAMVQRTSEIVVNELTWRHQRLNALARLAAAADALKQPPKNVLDTIAKYLIGERPPRPQREAPPESHDEEPDDEEDVESLRAASRELLYKRLFSQYVSIRLHLESAYAKSGEAPPEALTKTLPEHLLLQVPATAPRQLLSAIWTILSRPPGCSPNAISNDEALYAAIVADIRSTPEKYKGHVSAPFMAKMKEEVSSNARGAELIQALERAME